MKIQITSLVILLLLSLTHQSLSSQQINDRAACPVIKVECPGDFDQNTTLLCYASLLGVDFPSGVTFKWTVTGGVIKQGEDTTSVLIDPAGFPGIVKVTLEVGGLPRNSCPNRASAESVAVISDPGAAMLVGYGDITFEKEREYLDTLAERLRADPGSKPYIIAYAGRNAYVDEAKERADRAKRYLVEKQGIVPERVITVDGGYREIRSVELWIVPPGATEPSPAPALQPSEVQILNGKKPDNSSRSQRRKRL